MQWARRERRAENTGKDESAETVVSMKNTPRIITSRRNISVIFRASLSRSNVSKMSTVQHFISL